MKNLLTAAAIAVSVILSTLIGQAVAADGIEISEPFARASAGLAKNGAAFFTITDRRGEGDRLISASSDVSKRTEFHTHLQENGVFKMRHVESIEVPPGGSQILKPGGYHVMFMGLKKPLEEGEEIHLTLEFEKAGSVMVMVPVGKVGAMSAYGHGTQGHGTMRHKHDKKHSHSN